MRSPAAMPSIVNRSRTAGSRPPLKPATWPRAIPRDANCCSLLGRTAHRRGALGRRVHVQREQVGTLCASYGPMGSATPITSKTTGA